VRSARWRGSPPSHGRKTIWDVLVVGARVAGSSLAILLGRQGRVLLGGEGSSLRTLVTPWLVLVASALVGGCVAAAQDAGLPPTAVADGGPGAARETHEARDPSLHVILPPVTADELTRLMAPTKGQPLQIGFPRPVPAEYRGDLRSLLTWRRADGAMTAAFTVTSPAAHALRLGLRVARLPDGVEFRFFGVSRPTEVFGPLTARDVLADAKEAADTGNDSAVFWSPVVTGDTIGVEIRLSDPDQQADLRVSLAQISHLSSPAR